MFEVKFTPAGSKDLKKLPRETQTRVLKKTDFFVSQPDPIAFAGPLVNLPLTTHRFRVGNYRVAFLYPGGHNLKYRFRRSNTAFSNN